MPKYFIKYFDVINAETIEDAKDILMEQLMLDVRNEDGSIKLFDIPNYDYSYICDGIDVDDLHERDEGGTYT